MEIDKTDITTKTVEERAKLGVTISFQNPPEITGVKLADLLKLCLGKKTLRRCCRASKD
ncbi:hypothetical protein IMZ68_06740 [Candidatus Bathyarchaeota archaeon]|nr:hypothetical protein [Candidatus Bathyarchaeota archaeon]